MSNDAKLGLVLGLAIVLVIALVFFRSDTPDGRPPDASTALKKDATPTQIAPQGAAPAF
jgi:hypothetical protein